MTKKATSVKYANIGSISSGTLRDEDLVDAFASELAALYKYTWGARMPPHVKKLLAEADKLTEEDFANGDGGEIVGELQDELEHFAPPFAYFGASEGDGADFGFWISGDALRDAIHDGEVLVQDDSRNGRRDKIPRGYTGYLLHISDHGNESLTRYRQGRYMVTIW